MVGGYILSEEHQLCVAIASRHIAKHLIVGAVLLNDVDDVLKLRIVPAGPRTIPSVRGGNATGVSRKQRRRKSGGCDPQRSIELSKVIPKRTRHHTLAGNRPVRIGMATVPLAAQNQDVAAIL